MDYSILTRLDSRRVFRVIVFFFFKQKTAYEILTCDWSSDVCSSDLLNNVLDPLIEMTTT